jgi:hypothetical protein
VVFLHCGEIGVIQDFLIIQARSAAPSTGAFDGVAGTGVAGMRRVFRRVGNPSENPRQKRGAEEISGSRVAFLLVTFLWRRKEKLLGRGSEYPHQTTVA